jgi:hypothetical protein
VNDTPACKPLAQRKIWEYLGIPIYSCDRPKVGVAFYVSCGKGRMKMKSNPGLVILSVIVGMWLLSNPRCKRGCRTVAEHLITHGIDEFIAGL